MEGPLRAPWCIGAVFCPPQLHSTSTSPLVFNPLGNPQRLLSAAQQFQKSQPIGSKRKQPKSSIPYMPRDLLEVYLRLEDCEVYGNRLQGLQCGNGVVLVFFLCGEGADRIASTVCHQGSKGKWSAKQAFPIPQFTDDSKPTEWSISPSLNHSIKQLSAVWADGGTGLFHVAARTNYYVYFCSGLLEDDTVQFFSTAVSKFENQATHVAWSPHLDGNAAVMLENGTVCLFKVEAPRSGDPSGFSVLIPTATLNCPLEVQSPAVIQDQDHQHDQNEPKLGSDLATEPTGSVREPKKKWHFCEFGPVPHTLLIANSDEVFVFDLTEQRCHDSILDSSEESPQIGMKWSAGAVNLVANVRDSGCFRFCPLKLGLESIVAFGRDYIGGTLEFSIATEQHVILFDTRWPQTAILQWEHGMKQDPPSLLIMCPLSALRSFNDEGRAILAASFKSGDVRVFCYGPEDPRAGSRPARIPKKQKIKDRDLGTPSYPWDIPSRLYAPLADVKDWRDVLGSSQGVHSQTGSGLSLSESHRGENLSGIVLLFEKSSRPTWIETEKTFTVLQLTGQGELLSQTYKADNELKDPPKASISSVDDKSDAGGSTRKQGSRHSEVKFEYLPAFLKYMLTGSILNPNRSFGSSEVREGYLSANGATNKWANQDSHLSSSSFENVVSTTDLETQLRALLPELNIPLNMRELARKVLGMALQERLSRSDGGIPSDLDAHWHQGYKFPLVTPLLGSTAPDGSKSGDAREEDEGAHATSLTAKKIFQKTIPLPLLLEISNLDKPDKSEAGHSSDDESSGWSKSKGVTFKDGLKILAEGSQKVEGLIEQLVSESEPYIVSLSQPSHDWEENSNSGGEMGLKILLYKISEKGGSPNGRRGDSEPEASPTAVEKTAGAMGMAMATETVANGQKRKLRTFGEDLNRKFVVGKASLENVDSHTVKPHLKIENEDSHQAKPHLKIDPKVCPIKLSFRASGCLFEKCC